MALIARQDDGSYVIAGTAQNPLFPYTTGAYKTNGDAGEALDGWLINFSPSRTAAGYVRDLTNSPRNTAQYGWTPISGAKILVEENYVYTSANGYFRANVYYTDVDALTSSEEASAKAHNITCEAVGYKFIEYRLGVDRKGVITSSDTDMIQDNLKFWDDGMWVSNTVELLTGPSSGQTFVVTSNDENRLYAAESFALSGDTGELTSVSDASGDTGKVTLTSTTFVEDSSKSWSVGEWLSSTVVMTNGTHSGDTFVVTSNDATNLYANNFANDLISSSSQYIDNGFESGTTMGSRWKQYTFFAGDAWCSSWVNVTSAWKGTNCLEMRAVNPTDTTYGALERVYSNAGVDLTSVDYITYVISCITKTNSGEIITYIGGDQVVATYKTVSDYTSVSIPTSSFTGTKAIDFYCRAYKQPGSEIHALIDQIICWGYNTQYSGFIPVLDIGDTFQIRDGVYKSSEVYQGIADSGKSWDVGEWLSAVVTITAGTFSGETFTVTSNGETMLYSIAGAGISGDIGEVTFIPGGDWESAPSYAGIGDSGKSWTIGEWLSAEVTITKGESSGETFTVTSNVADTIYSVAIDPVSSELQLFTENFFPTSGYDILWVTPKRDADGNIYVAAHDGGLFCFNSGGATLKWYSPLSGDGCDCTVAFKDGEDVLYVGGFGNPIWDSWRGVYAIYTSNGNCAWFTSATAQIVGNVILNSSGNIVYHHGNLLACIDASGGAIWSVNTSGTTLCHLTMLSDNVYFQIGTATSNINRSVWCVNTLSGITVFKTLDSGCRYDGDVDVDLDGNCYYIAQGHIASLDAAGTLRWKSEMSNSLIQYKSPTYNSGVVYAPDKRQIKAYDSVSGILLWTGLSSFESESKPVVLSGAIYVMDYYSQILIYNPAGDELNRVPIGERVTYYGLDVMSGDSPTLTLGYTYTFGENGVLILKANTVGVRKSSFGDFQTPYSYQLFSDLSGSTYVPKGKVVYSYSYSGSVAWNTTTSGNTYVYFARPGADGTVYAITDGNQVIAMSSDGSVRWVFDHAITLLSTTGWEFHEIRPGVHKVDGSVYFGGSGAQIHARNSDGTEKWKFSGATLRSDISVGGEPNSAFIYFAATDNKMYCIADDGTKQWSTATTAQQGVCVESDIWNNSFMYGTNHTLYCLNSGGTTRWTRAQPNGMDIVFYINSIVAFDAGNSSGYVVFAANYSKLHGVDILSGVIRWTKTVIDDEIETGLVKDLSGEFLYWGGCAGPYVAKIHVASGTIISQATIGDQPSPFIYCTQLPDGNILALNGTSNHVYILSDSSGDVASTSNLIPFIEIGDTFQIGDGGPSNVSGGIPRMALGDAFKILDGGGSVLSGFMPTTGSGDTYQIVAGAVPSSGSVLNFWMRSVEPYNAGARSAGVSKRGAIRMRGGMKL